VAAYEFDSTPERTTLAGIAIADGRVTDITGSGWDFVDSMTWLADGSGLLVSGAPVGSIGGGDNHQVWRVAYPHGTVRRVTNDTNRYSGVSLSADGQTLATTQSRRAFRLWTAPAGDLGAGEAVGGGPDGERVFHVASTGTSVLFTSENPRTGTSAIVIMQADGTGRRTLTRDGLDAHNPLVPRGGGVVVFTAAQADGVPHVWRMDLDGGNLRQLTHGAGESAEAVSPDGQTVLLSMRSDAAPPATVFRMPMSGGTPERLLENIAFVADFSPDGQHLLVSVLRDEGGRQRQKLELIPAGGGPVVRSWDQDENDYALGWSPSGDALEFIREVDGAVNIWRRPLAGGDVRRVTAFTNDELGSYAWTTDGRLFYTRWQTLSVDVVLITNFR
jgi:Tol biopolymer transport system component